MDIDRYKKFFDDISGLEKDLEVICDDKIFTVNKAVISARSPYFKKVLEDSPPEFANKLILRGKRWVPTTFVFDWLEDPKDPDYFDYCNMDCGVEIYLSSVEWGVTEVTKSITSWMVDSLGKGYSTPTETYNSTYKHKGLEKIRLASAARIMAKVVKNKLRAKPGLLYNYDLIDELCPEAKIQLWDDLLNSL